MSFNISTSFNDNQRLDLPLSEKLPRKRSRDGIDQIDVDRKPFSIQPDDANPFTKPRTFTPLSIVPRSRLPLAYLDTAQDVSRIFTAYIPVLEALHDVEDVASVLIANDGTQNRFYAIEHVHHRKYALCRLASWVKEEEVTERSKPLERALSPQPKRLMLANREKVIPWWGPAAVRPHDGKTAYSLRDGAGSSNRDTEVNSRYAELPRVELNADLVSNNINSSRPGPHHPDNGLPSESVTAPGALEELTRQYQDILYISRTPLAFFAKGPLARVRAAFADHGTTESQPSELLSFLRATILPSTVMDKKYREAIVEIIKEMSVDTPNNRKPRKRKWKPKRDKAGFFSDERQYVEQWWHAIDDAHAAAASESIDVSVKRCIPNLRNRETYLQIMLILEAMIIEMPTTELNNKQAALENPKHDPNVHELNAENKKKRKDYGIAAILETLIDRLCIWCSLETSSPSNDGQPSDQKLEPGEELKSFCTEVIVPFYMSRIPKQAAMVSKKLGGPAAPSPARKKTGALSKPGQPAVRQAPEKKARKPLARVSTDTLNHLGRQPPALHRSATDSDLMTSHIKREGSAPPPPLHQITSANSNSQQLHQAAPNQRRSLMSQVSFSRREVDLSAMSQASEAKVRKKAEVEQKLRDAISTLKKPNRALAVEEIARNTDESFAKAIARSKPSSASYPHRKTHERSGPTTVTATPRHIEATPGRHRCHESESDGQRSRCTSTSAVPSSAEHRRDTRGYFPDSTPMIPQTGHRARYADHVVATPSRGFAKFMPSGLARQPGTLLESPTTARSLPVTLTPSRSTKMPAMLETPALEARRRPFPPASNEGQRQQKFETLSHEPIGAASYEASAVCKGSVTLKISTDQSSTSIYDSLGWNDD